jgi:DNA-binding SARP family transcriptional activator
MDRKHANVAQPSGPWLELRLLGGCELRGPDGPLHLETAKTAALLAFLVGQSGPQQRSKLVGLLWGDLPESRARANLRRTLWDLRRKLSCPHAPPFILTTRQTVDFNRRSSYWLDVEIFEQQIAGGESPADRLHSAINLYRGDFLDGFYVRDAPAFEEWVLAERERLRQMAIQALHALLRHHTARGEYTTGIEYAVRLLAMDPWREEAHRALMRLLALSGQRSAALAQYEECRRLLKRELGLDPLEETTALYEQIRSAPPFAGPLGPSPPCPSAPPIPFVGRAEEHGRLVAWWEEAQRGTGRLALVEGEAGVGKTRLMEEIAHYAETHGATVLHGRCYEFGDAVPYQPIADALRSQIEGRDRDPLSPASISPVWLAELSRLLPELREMWPDLPTPAQAPGEAARQRLFEAVARCLREMAARAPCLLFLDDLHWADPSTLDLIHYLARQTGDTPLGIAGTYRSEEVSLSHPLTRLRQGLSRDHLVDRLVLSPLSQEAVAAIARSLVGDREGEALGTFLYQESEGNPFILTETVSELQEQGILLAGEGKLWSWTGPPTARSLPASVQDAVLQRVGRLCGPAQRLLTLAAVIGRQFDFALLQAAAGPDAAAVPESVDQWLARRLVQRARSQKSGVRSQKKEQGDLTTDDWLLTTVYDFSHDKIRAVVYHAAGGRLPVLHRQVGEALQQLYASRLPTVYEELAYHYEQAGDIEQAVYYLPLAAAKATAAYAHLEALDYDDRALALLGEQDERRWEILLQRAQVLRFLTRFDEAIADCEQVLAAASGHPNGELPAARAAVELGALHRIRRDYDRAWAWGEHGSRLLRTTDELREPERLKALARAREELGKIEQERGNLESAQRLLEEALALYRKQGHPRGVAESLKGLGRILLDQGRNDVALQNLNEALAIFRDLGDRQGEADCLAIIGHSHWEQGHFDSAQRAFDESLNICRAIGDRRGKARCLGNLGLIHLAQENYDRAQQNWEESAALYDALRLEKRTAAILRWLGILGELRGDYASAQTRLQESLAIDRATGARVEEMLDRAWLGRALLERGEYGDARHYLQTALALNEAFAHSEDVSFFLIWLAGVAYESGKLDEARGLLQKARAQQGSEGMPWGAYEASWQATIELALDEEEAALATARKALAEAEAGGKRRERGIAHALMGVVLGRLDPVAGEDPQPYFEQALTLLPDWPFAYGQALRRYGAYLLRSDDRERGMTCLQEARDIFDRLGAKGEREKTSLLLAGDESPWLRW